jgi:hypothetical protein
MKQEFIIWKNRFLCYVHPIAFGCKERVCTAVAPPYASALPGCFFMQRALYPAYEGLFAVSLVW